MTLVFVGAGLVLLAALGGITLISLRLTRRRLPFWLLVAHPVTGFSGLICLWAGFALWRGTRNLPLDAGVLVLTFAFAGGLLMFALRATDLPRPLFVVALHGAAALFGCALLLVGLWRFGAGV